MKGEIYPELSGQTLNAITCILMRGKRDFETDTPRRGECEDRAERDEATRWSTWPPEAERGKEGSLP